MAATLADVARLARVSTASASLVLSGNDQARVSEATRERILAAAAELNYVRNAHARMLRTQKNNVVAFVSDRIATTPYAVQMVHSANAVARDAGHVLMLMNTDDDRDYEDAGIRMLHEHNVDKVIYASMFHKEVHVPASMPGTVVILDGFSADPSIPSVVPDEVQAARTATQHLLAHGHTRIALLNYTDSRTVAGNLRLQGYREALEEAGIEFDPQLVLFTGTQAGVADAGAGLLLDRAAPTAMFCFNDEVAAGVYREAARRGLSIPGDLSVVGFDNFEPIVKNLDPPLSSMELPHARMGEWAARYIFEGGPAPASGWPYLMTCRLVERASVAAPRTTP